MQDLERIEAKLDLITDKLDNHLERLARIETSESWIKKSLGLMATALSTLFLKLFVER